MSKPYGVRAVLSSMAQKLRDRFAAVAPFAAPGRLQPVRAVRTSGRRTHPERSVRAPSSELCIGH